ncbi:hypothetical protein [Pseudoruegeria sp. HB172150]|uniref:hypothetical protein n=1 Tax=Pseudoruegeria sp. HB172150 TaxID=2721164 RepID=UPI0015557C23|nr:hypothetical protein [Pseudoruegeria sp. HB172150]
MTNNKIEAKLLYGATGDMLDRVDRLALESLVENLGFPIEDRGYVAGDYISMTLPGVQVVIAYTDKPFAIRHFRGVTRPPEDEKKRRKVLQRLSNHKASISIVALDRTTGGPVPQGRKQRLVWELVDHILTVAHVDLVQCPGLDRLMTGEEAEDWLTDIVDRIPDFAFEASHDRNSRKAIFMEEPHMSPRVADWLGQKPEDDEEEDLLGDALRAFLAHQDGPETKSLSDTAAGRSALYILSATIMIFALPLGASALTYNALSGGSFRFTAYTMAATGLISVGEKMGLTETAMQLMPFLG